MFINHNEWRWLDLENLRSLWSKIRLLQSFSHYVLVSSSFDSRGTTDFPCFANVFQCRNQEAPIIQPVFFFNALHFFYPLKYLLGLRPYLISVSSWQSFLKLRSLTTVRVTIKEKLKNTLGHSVP